MLLIGLRDTTNPFALAPSCAARSAGLPLAEQARAAASRSPTCGRAWSPSEAGTRRAVRPLATSFDNISRSATPADYEPTAERRASAAIAARTGRDPVEVVLDDCIAGGDGQQPAERPAVQLQPRQLRPGQRDAHAPDVGARPRRRRRPLRHHLRRAHPHYDAHALDPRPRRRRALPRRVGREEDDAATPRSSTASSTAACWRPGYKADVNLIDYENLAIEAPRDRPRPARRGAAGFVQGRRLRRHDRERRGHHRARRAHGCAARPAAARRPARPPVISARR